MEIKKLAPVQMGYSFRSRLEASEGGGVAVIQMTDLLDDNTVGCDDLKGDQTGQGFTRVSELVYQPAGCAGFSDQPGQGNGSKDDKQAGN